MMDPLANIISVEMIIATAWMITKLTETMGGEQNSSGSFLEMSIEVWPSVGVTTR